MPRVDPGAVAPFQPIRDQRWHRTHHLVPMTFRNPSAACRFGRAFSDRHPARPGEARTETQQPKRTPVAATTLAEPPCFLAILASWRFKTVALRTVMNGGSTVRQRGRARCTSTGPDPNGTPSSMLPERPGVVRSELSIVGVPRRSSRQLGRGVLGWSERRGRVRALRSRPSVVRGLGRQLFSAPSTGRFAEHRRRRRGQRHRLRKQQIKKTNLLYPITYVPKSISLRALRALRDPVRPAPRPANTRSVPLYVRGATPPPAPRPPAANRIAISAAVI